MSVDVPVKGDPSRECVDPREAFPRTERRDHHPPETTIGRSAIARPRDPAKLRTNLSSVQRLSSTNPAVWRLFSDGDEFDDRETWGILSVCGEDFFRAPQMRRGRRRR